MSSPTKERNYISVLSNFPWQIVFFLGESCLFLTKNFIGFSSDLKQKPEEFGGTNAQVHSCWKMEFFESILYCWNRGTFLCPGNDENLLIFLGKESSS